MMAGARNALEAKRARKRQQQSVATERLKIGRCTSPAATSPPKNSAAERSLRDRKDVKYLEPNISKGMPYSQMAGTTSQAIQRDVRQIFARIDELTSGPRALERRQELLSALVDTDDFQSVIQPAPEYTMLSRGVAAQIAAFRAESQQHSFYGRIANNVLMAAVVRGIEEADQVEKDGRIDRLAGLVGVNRSTLWRAAVSCVQVAMLDPTRCLRVDALQGDDLLNVLDIWEKYTRPEPAVGLVVRMRLEPGVYDTHAVHWQEERTADLYLRLVQEYGPVCQLSQFYEERPYYVRKPQAQTSLCPYCYHMKLMMVPYARLLDLVRADTNQCQCAFCRFHKNEKREKRAVPRHANDLFKLCFCPKPTAPSESGFAVSYPCYSPSCLLVHLSPNDARFFASHIPELKACTKCNTYPVFGGDDCKFMDTVAEAATVVYQHAVQTPRSGRSGKEGQTREVLEWTSASRRQFQEQWLQRFAVTVNHRYRVDWQDEFALQLYKLRSAGHCTLTMDFGMSWEITRGEEMKQEFFEHASITIHSTCSYSEWPPNTAMVHGADTNLRMDAFFGLSDDPQHDPTFVKLHMRKIIASLDAQRAADGRCEMAALSVMTDGGPGHYKQRKNFAAVRPRRCSSSGMCLESITKSATWMLSQLC
jgi:hypothetical protein